MAEAGASDSPMESYNRLLIEQINAQLMRGFDARLQATSHCVVRTKVSGVLSVLPSGMVSEEHDAVFGPKPFEACIEYVNASLVARETRERPDQKHDPHDAHESHER